MQERRLADARKPEHEHHEARETEPEPAMRRTSVAKEVEVVRHRVPEAGLLRLTSELRQSMLALRARRDLDALPHEVEASRHRGVVLVTHVIKRPERRRILGEKQELATVRFERPLCEQPFAGRIEITRLRF